MSSKLAARSHSLYGATLERISKSNGIFASLERMEAGHPTGVGTRYGLIRCMPERHGASRDTWYQMPCPRTQSPPRSTPPAESPFRGLDQRVPLTQRLPCLARLRSTVRRLVADRFGGATAARRG